MKTNHTKVVKVDDTTYTFEFGEELDVKLIEETVDLMRRTSNLNISNVLLNKEDSDDTGKLSKH